MIKRIIVEGPDCSGKSTVVERLKNLLKWDSKSLHHFDGDQFKRYSKEYIFGEKIVFDRGHISEIVYSKLWRNGNPFNEEEESVLDFLLKKDSLIIFACPDLETMKKRYELRGFSQQIKLEELEKSRQLFIEKLKDVGFILYNSENFEELDNLIEKVRRIVK